ncbi:alanine/glycine:cation symporter family protein [Neisseria dumasiana]|uniref:Sodium:alanine symporter family protein n=1 Tax=Neisseria dumasiana TaxID=1931275 RepID=A0A1X3DG54_9NEIS|nr:sodium:alanine symporter family protein [Neisseria dumasiana]OSI16021.1 sodium:alanine symporter family protein [Neisseria dumasiana]OSI18684.1 sodium:alanine symporter family protein [Neisseria dumasiana]OSI34882.1 sodium:alanine symporter family protein [Neisseria dumasiana]UOO84098.1 sodium:alanine symporter family protein [Neisseria dumasiana]
MDALKNFFDTVGGWVWGPAMLVLLVGTGILLTVMLKGLQFSMLGYALKQAFMPHRKKEDGSDHDGDISHFGALMTALSATIGTGNIAGVATAVVAGGPGAVFWMWITAIFGMATKYGEGVLAVKYRVTNKKGEMSGGPMYYIERGLGSKWKWLAYAFALFGTVASFGIGSSVQSNSVAQAVQTSFNIDPLYTGIALTILTAIVVLGGIRSIATASSLIVPLMAVLYVTGGIVVILMNFELVIPAVKLILTDAFTGQAVAGGALGSVIRYGVARGVFSNEAGMGSAPIAAAAAKTDHPVRQALVSMTGTFLDTIIVCSITGIILVMGLIGADGVFVKPEITGAALTTTTFDQLLPGPGGWVVTIGLIFFAYSTILGWCYYGEKCAAYVFGDSFANVYRVIYVATVMIGTVASLDLVWLAADTFNGLMAIPNLIALILLSGVIVKETQDFKAKRKSGELH